MNTLESHAMTHEVFRDLDRASLCNVIHSASKYAPRPRGLF